MSPQIGTTKIRGRRWVHEIGTTKIRSRRSFQFRAYTFFRSRDDWLKMERPSSAYFGRSDFVRTPSSAAETTG